MAVGFRPNRLRVVTAMQVVGLILTTALVTPAAMASLVTARLSRTMPVAAVLAVGSAEVGLLLSYHLRVPSGAAIVLTAAAGFLVTSIAQRAIRRRLGSPRSAA